MLRVISVSGRVGIPAVGALGGGGGATIEDGFEVASFGAGGVGASVFSLRMVKRAKGADGRFLFAPVFDVSKLPALLALGLGGG